MFDDVPVRVWLLLLIAVIAWTPMRYVFRHVANPPSRHDITQPADDLSWRSSAALTRNAMIVVGLAALAIFIFTPAATEFARSSSFLPILMVGLGAFALWSVAKGLMTGSVEPMVRGTSWVFARTEHPKRFWASMGWNMLLGGFMLFFGIQLLIDAPTQALQDRCHNRNDAWSPKEALDACELLLVDRSGNDRSAVIASRGSAHFRLGAYHRAGADYAAAIRLDPRDSSSHYNLGLVHEQLGDRRRAVLSYDGATQTDPENEEAFQNRGLIHLDSGRFDQAISDFDRAHELVPTDMTTLANRGVAYAWKNDRIRAERDFAAVRRSDPSNLVLLHGEAILAIKQGNMKNGVRLLREAIARDPNDVWARSMIVDAYRKLGDGEEVGDDGVASRH